jgi:regulator of sigma E protease
VLEIRVMYITLIGMMSWMHSAGLTLVSFAVLISVIVFFHELGHLLVGKWLGVKAVRFSIGFGPKLFGVQWGETEYRVSLLPLGGYVKFAGDNPLEQLAPEDRGRGFLEQPPRKKAAIAFAGPAANFLLALVLYFAVNAAPHRDLAAKVGYVKPGSPAAQARVRYGDRIVAVDGEKVDGFLMLQEKIRAHAGQPLTLTVERGGQRFDVRLTPAVHEETNPIETVKQGRIGISAAPRIAEIALTGPDTPAARAGLKTFDLVVKVAGQPVPNYEELERRLSSLRGPVPIEVLRRLEVPAPGGTLWAQEPVPLTLDAAGAASGIECADLNLFAVQPGSAAEEAGLRRGDRVISIDGKPVVWWFDEVETVRRAKGAEPFPMTVRRDGKLLTVTVRQRLRTERDESGIRVQVPELGAAPDAAIFSGETERIWVRYPIGEAAARSFTETVGAIRGLALGIAKIVSGRISSEAIGGPIMIADVARKAADAGWQMFVYVMAMISVNLGLMNLIPLPVLDGFHVLSAGIEGIRRRPLSLRFREIANVVGIALVLGLMLFALRNDAMRKFFE